MFPNTGAAFAQTFTVTETSYSGAFIETDTCAPMSGTIATVTPRAANGPSVMFTVTPVAAGSCIIKVTDSMGQTATVNVTVTVSSVIISDAFTHTATLAEFTT